MSATLEYKIDSKIALYILDGAGAARRVVAAERGRYLPPPRCLPPRPGRFRAIARRARVPSAAAAAPCWKSSTGNALRSKFPASAAPSIAARARGAS